VNKAQLLTNQNQGFKLAVLLSSAHLITTMRQLQEDEMWHSWLANRTGLGFPRLTHGLYRAEMVH